jgi:hypothetical protein
LTKLKKEKRGSIGKEVIIPSNYHYKNALHLQYVGISSPFGVVYDRSFEIIIFCVNPGPVCGPGVKATHIPAVAIQFQNGIAFPQSL